jgi:hypothetical protein
MHLLALAVTAAFRLNDRLVEEVRKIVGMDVGPEDHITTTAAIAAIRTAPRDKLLATKAHAASATIAGLGINFYSIDKHMGNPAEIAGDAT